MLRIPVDDDGIRTDLLPHGPAAMALVTPEHQRPFGVVMSEARPHALLAWAERSGAVIIADDVDGELRYDSVDARPLTSLDRAGRVIRLGGFALPWARRSACLSGSATLHDRQGASSEPAD
jgi:GntR family transcriptional regulator / MocR family aminotransferase